LLNKQNAFHTSGTPWLFKLLHPRMSSMFVKPGAAPSFWLQKAGGRANVLYTALIRAVAWCEEVHGKDTSLWQWGAVHEAKHTHPIQVGHSIVDSVFAKGNFALGGGPDTVLRSEYVRDNEGLESSTPLHTASNAPMTVFRMVSSMTDSGSTWMSMHLGQSGRFASPWKNGLGLEVWLRGLGAGLEKNTKSTTMVSLVVMVKKEEERTSAHSEL